MKISIRVQQSVWVFRLRWSLATILCSNAALSEPQISGQYKLQTAGGKTLPAVVAENKANGYQLEVTGGWMTLSTDQTFTWRTAYRTTQQGDVRTSESGGKGRYLLNGTTVSLTLEDSSEALEGTLRNGTLAIQADVKLVYRKDGGT